MLVRDDSNHFHPFRLRRAQADQDSLPDWPSGPEKPFLASSAVECITIPAPEVVWSVTCAPPATARAWFRIPGSTI